MIGISFSETLRRFALALRRYLDKLEKWLVRTTWLERIGLTALVLLLVNTFFSFNVEVHRKPILTSRPVSQPVQKTASAPVDSRAAATTLPSASALEASVLPTDGVTIPVRWGDLGEQLVDTGVIDRKNIDALYASRGGVSAYMETMLTTNQTAPLVINQQNASELLNLLWAFGLGNKNDILDSGEMSDPRYGGAGGFASTGGWTVASGDPMSHYSAHPFVVLTADEQALVDRVSRNIYRPCCGNSTHFPDCNHGMAMLGLLELMAAQGADEATMYQTALVVNSHWFPDTYLTIATYFSNQGIAWKDVDPKQALSSQFSSASGYQQVASVVTPVTSSAGGNGCST
ncbi:hypothetical protein COV04_01105 [Candidatus Uhrbacteria bacterium CG10_big_fil_rev_8_21_14_0_10_48_11]|uniref:Uncharacterized protein n=1 Tax=Candidatus Uhrbacteria bacterium CG10_big_fil_rev_8_21_14_0_10_48_11 TaxID=1975037 RepID=A0A2M8LF88_9BACT|nr:MAG: hypothetical protein COV04_01105 [Candidatus Uhrbacteria bacterium CG10_big_fil_rev_8_21_14_0_10_48_11]